MTTVSKEVERLPIVFNDDDLEGISLPHSDPLCIIGRIDGYDVARILVDQGSE